jgi:hypothetical protein
VEGEWSPAAHVFGELAASKYAVDFVHCTADSSSHCFYSSTISIFTLPFVTGATVHACLSPPRCPHSIVRSLVEIRDSKFQIVAGGPGNPTHWELYFDTLD